jgi:acyl-coenzyme A synthetase/AMP-(fatty) acid ligase
VLLVDEIAPRDAEPPVAGAPRADAPAWLLYTSGTTGPPKGVVHTSRSLLHFAMNYTNALRIAPEDRLIGTRPMSVIGGVRDVLAALLNGAAVFPFDVRREGLAGLAAWVRAYGLTIAFLTSPLFRAFAETLDGPWSLPSVRALRLGSDTVHLADVELYRRHLPATCLLINGLGGTETGTICKFFMDKDSVLPHATVPIGYGLDDMTPLVLGEDGREAAPGEVGELAVRSRYLALGYWRRPDLTESVFRPDPAGGDERVYLTGNRARRHPDGCVEHLGRRDLQTKVRGFRVELSEVETALLGVDGIREAVVVARPDAAGERGLVAYVVLEASPGPTPGALRRALAGRLPEHMIPSRIVALDAMPLTPNGKVDRAALPAHTRMRPALDVEFMAPRTPFERIVADIWADALGLDRVGVLDPFLDLGGDSLLAARIVGRVIAALPVTVPAPALLDATTVEEMALTAVERALQERE